MSGDGFGSAFAIPEGTHGAANSSAPGTLGRGGINKHRAQHDSHIRRHLAEATTSQHQHSDDQISNVWAKH